MDPQTAIAAPLAVAQTSAVVPASSDQTMCSIFGFILCSFLN
jgi:hypothetical protein